MTTKWTWAQLLALTAAGTSLCCTTTAAAVNTGSAPPITSIPAAFRAAPGDDGWVTEVMPADPAAPKQTTKPSRAPSLERVAATSTAAAQPRPAAPTAPRTATRATPAPTITATVTRTLPPATVTRSAAPLPTLPPVTTNTTPPAAAPTTDPLPPASTPTAPSTTVPVASTATSTNPWFTPPAQPTPAQPPAAAAPTASAPQSPAPAQAPAQITVNVNIPAAPAWTLVPQTPTTVQQPAPVTVTVTAPAPAVQPVPGTQPTPTATVTQQPATGWQPSAQQPSAPQSPTPQGPQPSWPPLPTKPPAVPTQPGPPPGQPTTTATATTGAPPWPSSTSPSSSSSATGETPGDGRQGQTPQIDGSGQQAPQPAQAPQFGSSGQQPQTSVQSGSAQSVQELTAAARRGWSSGASGEGLADGSFASWRGSPTTIIGTWADTSAEVQTQVKALDDLQGWSGDVDLAVGGTAVNEGSETYAKAAAGEYRDRWVTMAKKIEQSRGQAQGATYVRPWHEFNGDWYSNWQVTPGNAEDYKKSFRLMAQVLRENCPSCVIVWSPNNGSSSGSASIDAAYPGDDVVDVVSIDSYNANGNPIVTDQASWQEYANATKGSDPVGVEAWRVWAEKHGKPLGFSEWGLNPGGGGGDNPEYIKQMNAWMEQHAAAPGETNPAGKVLFDVYFNVDHGGTDRFKIKDGPNVESGKVYQSLSWGKAADQPSQQAQSASSSSGWNTISPQPSTAQQSSLTPPLQPSQVMLPAPAPVGVRAGVETVKDVPDAPQVVHSSGS